MTDGLTSAVGATYLDNVDLRCLDRAGTMRSFGQEVALEFDLPNDESLPTDMLALFSRADLQFPESHEMEADHLRYHGAIRAVLDTEDFAEIRLGTVTDPSLALFAAEIMRQPVLDYLRSGGDGTSIEAATGDLREQIQAVDDYRASFGLDTIGGWGDLPFDERLEMVRQLQRHVGRLRPMLGRLNQVAGASPMVSRARAGETVGLVMGNDITALSTAELVNLATPALAPDFWARWADNAVLVRHKEDARPLGDGPIVLVGDESSSMTGNAVDGHTSLDWLKALLVTLHKTGRPLTYLPFSSAAGIPRHTSQSFTGYLAALRSHMRGGTDVEAAMERAVELAGEHGDIVLLTDGEFRLPRDVINVIKSAGPRVCTILVGDEENPSAKAFSDTYVTVSELTADTIIDVKEALSEPR